MSDNKSSCVSVRHGGTGAREIRPQVTNFRFFYDPILGTPRYSELPPGWRLASEKDFRVPIINTPYLVKNYTEEVYECKRIKSSFPWQDFEIFLKNNRVYVQE